MSAKAKVLRVAREPAPAPEPDLDLLPSLVAYKLRHVHGLFVEGWSAFFGRLGLSITPVQGGMLILIDRHAGLTQIALARLLDVEGSTLHQSIRRLHEAGLVDLAPAPSDRRAHALRLTPEGREAVRLIRAQVNEHEAEVLAPLTPEERRILGDLLGRILAARGELSR